MARAVWTGSISFGLVTVPVGLFVAVSEHDVRFNQLQRGTADRIRYKRVNERTGAEVPTGDIVRAREVSSGQFVVVTQEDLDALAPRRSRTLDVTAFVELRDIDPVYFDKTYWLGPASADAVKAYRLLAETMTRTGTAALGTFVLRGKEHLAAIRATQGVLALHTLFFADEVRDPRREVDLPREPPEFGDRELALASQLVESMRTAWEPAEFRDTYATQVEEMIAAKAAGLDVVTAPEAPAPTGGGDLLASLLASLEAAAQAAAPAAPPAAAAAEPPPVAQPNAADAGPGVPPKRSTRRSAGPPPASLEERRQAVAERVRTAPKADLDRWARQLEIAGRSKMTVAQLRQAITDAGGPPRKRRVS